MTPDKIKDAKFRGPIEFGDGKMGYAHQVFECATEPRLRLKMIRAEYKAPWVPIYQVDRFDVADADEASQRLAEPAREHPRDQFDRDMREPESRRNRLMGYAATSVADSGAFGLVEPAMERAGHSWHVAINRISAEDGHDKTRWLYNTKTAAFEMVRMRHLWRTDAKRDTGLTCAFGVKCRECPYLQRIEATLQEERTQSRGIMPPRDMLDTDVEMVKTLTCVGHILTLRGQDFNEAFLTTTDDREHERAFGEHMAEISNLGDLP